MNNDFDKGIFTVDNKYVQGYLDKNFTPNLSETSFSTNFDGWTFKKEDTQTNHTFDKIALEITSIYGFRYDHILISFSTWFNLTTKPMTKKFDDLMLDFTVKLGQTEWFVSDRCGREYSEDKIYSFLSEHYKKSEFRFLFRIWKREKIFEINEKMLVE